MILGGFHLFLIALLVTFRFEEVMLKLLQLLNELQLLFFIVYSVMSLARMFFDNYRKHLLKTFE